LYDNHKRRKWIDFDQQLTTTIASITKPQYLSKKIFGVQK